MNDSPQPMMETLALAGRQALRQLWSRRDERASMHPREQRILHFLEMHPEFSPYWEGREPDEDENPFLHVTYHMHLDNQLASGDPPQAKAAFERLTAMDVSEHDALHELLKVLIVELYRMTERGGAFNMDSYVKQLDALGTAADSAQGQE